MSRQTRSSDHDHESLHPGGATGIAPGKQTLTQSLRGRERAVASFDTGSELREDRATIDGPPTISPLTDRQLRKARRRNPHWQERLGFAPTLFGGGDIASGELADNVAARQAALGLAVDGIAGPKTIAAVTAAAPPAAAGPAPRAAPAPGARNPASAAPAAGAAPADDGRDHDLDHLFEAAGATPDDDAGAAPADDGRDHDLDALFDRTIADAGGAHAGPRRGPVDDPFGMHLLDH